MYKIKYPFFGNMNGVLVAILNENYAITSEHAGTTGFGMSAFISRAKIIKLFKYSKEITKQEFQKRLNEKFSNFINSIPGAKIEQYNFAGLITTDEKEAE